MFFKISFSAFRKVFAPRGFKIGSRLLETRRGVLDMPAQVGRRVKAALPAPLIDVDRDTRSGRNRADFVRHQKTHASSRSDRVNGGG
jgi:hypothetical protein